MNYFVTAIGTDSGKTLASAILTEALQADYWKPIQAGYPRDIEAVKKLVSNQNSIFHQEHYMLQSPMSPHAAAAIDGATLSLDDITLPKKNNKHLIAEGAGGMLVPINQSDFVIDIARKFDMELIIVINFYLGSINHSLLTLEAVSNRKLKVAGIIFNGEINVESKQIILRHFPYPVWLEIGQENKPDKETVSKYAAILNKNIKHELER